jgi:hypothetical protein
MGWLIALTLLQIILWPSFTHCQTADVGTNGRYIRLIGIKCYPKAEFVANMTCKTKAIGRNETAVTIKADIVKPQADINVIFWHPNSILKLILKFQAEFKMLKKKSSNEYSRLYGGKFRFCATLYGAGVPKIIRDKVKAGLNAFAPELMVPCPLKVL